MPDALHGQKFNQIRVLVQRGVEVMVVPWDHDITDLSGCDGVFVRYPCSSLAWPAW
jgi:carbamoylphosphate synthase small subunit